MIAKKHHETLPRIKKQVEKTYEYFRPNYDRYNDFKKFVFDTSMSEDDISLLKSLLKPQIECNIQEAFISRLRGEFSKQEPSIEVTSDYATPIDVKVTETVEGIFRHLLTEANRNNFEYDVYTDVLAGGFSVVKIWTEYVNEMSFDQVIKFDRVYEPTLCGFDPTARLAHKGDGQFCFENYPKTKEEFIREYPNIPVDQLKFTRDNGGFSWSYRTDRDDIVVICDFYEKKKKKVKIVQTVDNKTMTIDEYAEMVAKFEAEGRIEQPPAIKGEPRMSEMTTICRTRFIEDRVLEYVETDYKSLPLVFVDGNSVMIRDSVNGVFQQMTRPYVYHARGTQRLKNFAMQSLGNELENMIQHKFKVAKESLPQEEDYLEAYKNVQVASTLVYNAFYENDPDKPVPPPMEIQRVPIPPEISGTMGLTDQLMQMILGTFDASLGINDNQLSGVAIVEGATQSNAASMPYVVGFLQALTQVANVVVDLIPKYYITPRTVPTIGKNGKRSYQEVNTQQGVDLKYASNALQVKVEAGVNFAIQKSKALASVIALMQASPLFGQFMNTEGLDILLDNIEIRGIDMIKLRAEGWMAEMKKMQQEQSKQPNPDMMKIQVKQQEIQAKQQTEMAKLELDEKKIKAEIMKTHAELEISREETQREHEKSQTEKLVHAVNYAKDLHDQHHRHAHEKNTLAHQIKQDNKPQPKAKK